MKKLAVALAACATLALAACGTNRDDSLANVQENQAPADDLNLLANDAANDAAAEAEALGTQQQQLNQEANTAEDTREPAEDEDVSGM
ncbi:MAG TPA: hypothetical protein VNH53_06145 [Sphingomicrobium sp.]|nr:hypothetical protein [Sphingomicrobium sp.]